MWTSGEVRFLTSVVQTSTLLITTQDINPRPVKMIMQQRENPSQGGETIKRPQQLIWRSVFGICTESTECTHPFTQSCKFFQYCQHHNATRRLKRDDYSVILLPPRRCPHTSFAFAVRIKRSSCFSGTICKKKAAQGKNDDCDLAED